MRAELLDRSAIDPNHRRAMYRLLDSHFEGVTRDGFESDLHEKSHALLLLESGTLVGFTTLLIKRCTARTRPLTIVISGDTIVDPSAWGSLALLKAWLEAVIRLHSNVPGRELYWLLIVSGFRTYRCLPVVFGEYTPGPQGAPLHLDRLRDDLAGEHFGDRFDRQRGIVKLNTPQSLRSHLRDVPEQRQLDPHVRFFLNRNPGHEQGDELVCLTRIAEDNLTPVGRRLWPSSARLPVPSRVVA